MANSQALILGAVAYDAKVVTIWDGFKDYFESHGLAFDYVLYSNYEAQVEAHLAGHCHVAWNSPLAWIETARVASARRRTAKALAMRDTDRDLASVVLVGAQSGIRSVDELRGKRVAVGATDSPQATLIPLLHLAEAGLEPTRDFEIVVNDRLVGKHGDHIGGERDAVKALVEGRVEAACILDQNRLLFAREGTMPPGAVTVLSQTALYDHCNFTVLDDAPSETLARFRELLLSMSYEDAAVRPLLDLEGLKAWVDGRTSGYGQLERAVDRFDTLGPWLTRIGAR
jgi:ABC-type phosphate/phosphonate transport system substrate-binding protein